MSEGFQRAAGLTAPGLGSWAGAGARPLWQGAAGWRFPAALAAIILLGLALRLLCARDSLWVDEVASTHFAGQPLSNLWSDWMRRETNPPLYYSVLKGWIALVGDGSDVMLRWLSLAYGTAAMALAGLLGRRIAGPWAGLAAAALMAITPSQVHYSLEVRGFGQAQLAALVALYGAIGFFSATRPRERWLSLGLYVAGTIAALHSHTITILLPALVNGWALLWMAARRHEAPQPWRSWIGANALILAASSWWLSVTWWQLRHARNLDWIEKPTLAKAAEQVQIAYGPDWPALPPLPQDAAVLAAMVITVAAMIAMALRYRRSPVLLLALCAAGAPCLLFLLSQAKPVMIPRAFFWASGPFLITVALGLAALGRPRLANGLLALLLAINLSGTWSMIGRADGEPFRRVVADLSGQPDALLVADTMETGLALQRYCARTHCPLEIVALAGRESWTAGAPMRRIDARDMPALLACERHLYTLQRPLGAEKSYVPASLVLKHDLSGRYGPGNYLKVARLDSAIHAPDGCPPARPLG